MKCDDLENKDYNNGMTAYELMEENGLVNTAKIVKDAITELKAEINRKEAVGQRWFERCMEARTGYVRSNRVLWLAREWRAWCEAQFWFIINDDEPKDVYHLSLTKRIHRTPTEWIAYWQKVEQKCKAKAEEYK